MKLKEPVLRAVIAGSLNISSRQQTLISPDTEESVAVKYQVEPGRIALHHQGAVHETETNDDTLFLQVVLPKSDSVESTGDSEESLFSLQRHFSS